MTKLAASIESAPITPTGDATEDDLTRRSGRDSDGRPAGFVEEELPPVDERSRAYTRCWRDNRLKLRAVARPLVDIRTACENAIVDCQLVYPRDDWEQIMRRIRTAEGGSFPDAEQRAIDRFAAVQAQGDRDMDAVIARYGSAASISGFSGQSETEDCNVISEAIEFRAQRLASAKPDAIRIWNRHVVKSDNLDDANEMDEPPDDGYLDFGEEPRTERKETYLRRHDENMTSERRTSSRERAVLLEAMAGATYSFEEMELRRRQSPAEGFAVLEEIVERTYTVEERAWISGERSRP